MFQEGPIDGVIVRPLVQCDDARGWLIELFRADELPAEKKLALEIRKGMKRDAVERVLGMPTALGEAKGGDIYVHYKFDGHLRSVVYDRNDRVVAAYP